MLILFASQMVLAKNIPADYVDLGLPSGTLWKANNEQGRYTYTAAMYNFGNSLPSKAQFKELIRCCTWKWTGKGYHVTGPNQKSIYIPFDGYADCDENLHDIGVSARMWTIESSGEDSEWACYFAIMEGFRDEAYDAKCNSVSIRLVISE